MCDLLVNTHVHLHSVKIGFYHPELWAVPVLSSFQVFYVLMCCSQSNALLGIPLDFLALDKMHYYDPLESHLSCHSCCSMILDAEAVGMEILTSYGPSPT